MEAPGLRGKLTIAGDTRKQSLQFIDPTQGDEFAQGIVLCLTQMAVSGTVNALTVISAGSVAAFLAARPLLARALRWFMGPVFGLLAVRRAVDARR